jgi:ATP-dependent DNA ligase
LEGVVAKRRSSRYGPNERGWIKDELRAAIEELQPAQRSQTWELLNATA